MPGLTNEPNLGCYPNERARRPLILVLINKSCLLFRRQKCRLSLSFFSFVRGLGSSE